MCPTLKKLSKKLQPFNEVCRIINEMLAVLSGKNVRILEHILLYAEEQFGKEIEGKDYREREDGDRIINFRVDVDFLDNINTTIAEFYNRDDSLGRLIQDKKQFPYLERSLSILNPYLYHPKSATLDVNQNDKLLMSLFLTEGNMSVVTTGLRQFDTAEGHCQRCLAYARRFPREGADKTTCIFRALVLYVDLREHQGNYSGALLFAEEGYNLVAEAYNPVHPEVQKAAGILIDILIRKGDLFDAERFAVVTYGNLRDSKNGMDQEGIEMATGSYNLAFVILLQDGDLVKAEKLARESFHIRSLKFGMNHPETGASSSLLARILAAGKGPGDERILTLAKESLAIILKNQGPDGRDTAVSNNNLAVYYYQQVFVLTTIPAQEASLKLAKTHILEAIRIYSKVYGPTNKSTLDAKATLANILEIMH
jgi:hypothetical protein